MTDPKTLTAFAGIFLIVSGVGLIAAQMIVREINKNRRRLQAESPTPLHLGQIHLETAYVGLAVALLGVALMLAVTGIDFWKR